MFTEFMGAAKDLYDNVDSFFDDLIGETDLLDVVKTVGSALGDGAETAMQKSSTSASPMLDFDDSSSSNEGAYDFLKSQDQNKQAIKSVDANSIEKEWLERFRAISKGSVYGSGE